MSRYFIIFAGFPPTMANGGIFLVTTLPAAMMAPSPIVVFPQIRTLLPIHTLSSMFIVL